MAEPFIDEPGIYDVDETTYHADPVIGGSLSSSGARTLASRTPAHFAYDREHRTDSDAFDFGRAAHREVLGAGGDTVVVKGTGKDENAWRTTKDEENVKAVRDAGKTPIRPKDAVKIAAMAAKLRAHPTVGPLFASGAMHPEQALFWIDPTFGVWRRALLDGHAWLPDGRLLIVDYKTTADASPDSVAKSIANWGYHQQDPWYCDGAIATGLAGDLEPAFLFVFQEKDPPHLVSIAEVDPADREWGRLDNRRALRIYRDCVAADEWPGYPTDVIPVHLPTWAIRQKEAAYDRGAYDLTPKDVPA